MVRDLADLGRELAWTGCLLSPRNSPPLHQNPGDGGTVPTGRKPITKPLGEQAITIISSQETMLVVPMIANTPEVTSFPNGQKAWRHGEPIAADHRFPATKTYHTTRCDEPLNQTRQLISLAGNSYEHGN